MTVTFFGHSDAPTSVSERLYEVLLDLVCKKGANNFFVGTHGTFDRLALLMLKRLKKQYPHIRYTVVLAYIPQFEQEFYNETDTVFPSEVACAPPRFAIDKRNGYMLDQSDVVITYVTRSYGGAAKFKKKALLQGKRVIEISK